MEEIKDILINQANITYNKILSIHSEIQINIENDYNNKLEIVKNKYEKDLKKIETDASTFKNFGLIRNLTNENNELNRKVNSLLKEIEICKIKYNNLLFEYSKLLNTKNENINENENKLNENEKVDNNENVIEQLSEMKKIKIKGNSFYLSNKLVNNTYKFYDSNNIEVGYKNSSGKFYFNKL